MSKSGEGSGIARFARAIADPTRQELMRRLCCCWLCVGDLVQALGVTQPTVSHHLAVLRESGLVKARREGKQVFYTLNQDEVTICCGRIMRTLAPQKTLLQGSGAETGGEDD